MTSHFMLVIQSDEDEPRAASRTTSSRRRAWKARLGRRVVLGGQTPRAVRRLVHSTLTPSLPSSNPFYSTLYASHGLFLFRSSFAC